MRISIALSILVTLSFRMAGQSIPVIIQSTRLTAQSIRINQLGYYPHAPKIAVVTFSPGSVDAATTDQPFYLLSPHGHDTAYTGPAGPPDTVYTGRLGPLQHSTNSSITTRIADFSAITISLVPLVKFASSKVSPSLMLIALIPFVLGRE